MNKPKKYDIISIGDCTIDAFLKIEEATVECDAHHENCKICLSFADKIPYESLHLISAGNCSNVAVGSSRLGLKAAFYGTIGADPNGKVIMEKLKSEKVSTEFMSIQKNYPTNFHFVLWFRGERTILIKHQDYHYQLPKNIENTKWIYLSSIGPEGTKIQPAIARLLQKDPELKMAFNPGTFQLRMGVKKLSPLFKRTEILFVNKEEAELLLGRMSNDIKNLAHGLNKLGSKTVIITDGLKGSFCLDQAKFYSVGIYPHKPIEATGCGDAFATGFTAARILGLPIEEALRWGSRNGAGCATQIGPQAGLIHKREMILNLKQHSNFKAKILS